MCKLRWEWEVPVPELDSSVFLIPAHLNNSGWQEARVEVGLPHVRVHDLKHTFGRRLRAAGVSLEDRMD